MSHVDLPYVLFSNLSITRKNYVMKLNAISSAAFCLSAMLVLVSSCKKDAQSYSCGPEHATVASSAANAKSPDENLLKAVRNATSRYNSTTQAIKDGYQPTEQCVAVPGVGGMGYHWVNPDLVDGTFDPLKPEVMLYAKGPGGNLRLIAVEYIVINGGQPRPMFGDQPFDINGTPVPAPHWSLHVWAHETNPSGTFAPFNPNITCQ